MSTPLIIGQREVHTHSSSGRVSVAETRRKIIVKQGLYADLEALLPQKGGTFDGLRVVSAELTPSKGGMGLLTVIVRNPKKTGGGGGEDPEPETDVADEVVHEVETVQLEKPLMSHPVYSAYAGQIEMWRGSDPALRAEYKYTGADGETMNLEGEARTAAELILKGVESYLMFAPVCRRITRVSVSGEGKWNDVGKDCGKRCDPPAAVKTMTSGEWDWLKTGDRATETSGGGAERTEEWTGSDEWSQDLYETVNGGGSGGGEGGGEGGEA